MGIASDDYSACETYERNEEETRVERWWETYNHALTGYCARAQSMSLQGPDHIHEAATIQANLAHGELPKSPCEECGYCDGELISRSAFDALRDKLTGLAANVRARGHAWEATHRDGFASQCALIADDLDKVLAS